jgi:hypothetical protein
MQSVPAMLESKNGLLSALEFEVFYQNLQNDRLKEIHKRILRAALVSAGALAMDEIMERLRDWLERGENMLPWILKFLVS